MRLLSDPDVELMMTTGTLPLQIRINDVPIWHAMPADTDFVTYIIDVWPYDYVRVEACRDFIDDWHVMPNLTLPARSTTMRA